MKLEIFIRKYILFIVLMLFLSIELPIIITGFTCKPLPSDVMIVLGAKLIDGEPSTMLRMRLDQALSLYKEHYAPFVIVSGAQGADETTSEAAAMKNYLISHGIPEEKIHIEDQSFNTQQNLYNSHRIMQAYGYHTAIIVSNKSHMHRALFLAQNLGIDASGSAAPMADNTYLLAKQYFREGAAMAVLFIRGK